MELKDDVLEWFGTGEVGESSKAMQGVLSNSDNGNMLRNALAELIAERDALREALEKQHGVIDGAWETQPPDLYNEIASVLNKHSAENKSNTPDYVLAHFVLSSLEAFDIATNRRSAHFNGTSTTGESA